MSLLLTTSDSTPTRLCLQAGEADLSPSQCAPFFERMIQVANTPINEEEVDLSKYEDYTDATRQLGHFLDEVSMHKRIHSSLGYVTLAEFEEDWRRKPPPVPVEQERETESHQR